jgi:AcrR family transcriptional regulator
MTPDGRSTRFEHRRGELLSAAADFVLERGISEVSLRPMAAALGVSHKTLLHHFGTKENLFVEVMGELRGRERLFLSARAAEQPDDDEGAVELLRLTWARLSAADHEPFMRLLFELIGLALQDRPRFGPFLEQLVEDWTGSIELILRREGLGDRDAPRLATFVYDAMRGLLLDLLSTKERERVDGGFEELVLALEARLIALRAGAWTRRRDLDVG